MSRKRNPDPDKLTKLEEETLRYLGLRNNDICKIQNRKLRAVEKSIESILQKLGVNTRTQAILFCLKEKTIKLEEFHLTFPPVHNQYELKQDP